MKTNSSQASKKKLNCLTIFCKSMLPFKSQQCNAYGFTWTRKQMPWFNSFFEQWHAKIISHLDPNKAHAHDMLSIRMIKLCRNSICKALSVIFNDRLHEGKFPHEWKKANVVPVHKKRNKQSLKTYRPISLLPICSKIFERLIYNEMFTLFIETNLISPNQSGFRPGGSCVKQLLAIFHEIYKLFDEVFVVRGFLRYI